MNSVKMKREELLAIVRKNKEKHIADYLEAIADYKAVIKKITASNYDLALTGDLDQIGNMKHIPGKPVSYENDYGRAARMLELSVEDVIEVEQEVFNQLVLDEWDWKRSFTMSNSTYKAMM